MVSDDIQAYLFDSTDEIANEPCDACSDNAYAFLVFENDLNRFLCKTHYNLPQTEVPAPSEAAKVFTVED